MKKTLFVYLLTLISVIAHAQKLPGYIVMKNGDTLRGTIKKSNFNGLRGSKFYGNRGEKIKIVPGEVIAVKIDKEIYRSASVKSLRLREEFKNNGYVFVKLVISGEVSLYYLKYCYGGKTSAKRENTIYTERCPEVYFLKREGENYFEAYRKDKSFKIRKEQQRHTDNQLAGYFEDYEQLAKDLMYGKIERHLIDVIVKDYNDWKSKQ